METIFPFALLFWYALITINFILIIVAIVKLAKSSLNGWQKIIWFAIVPLIPYLGAIAVLSSREKLNV